MLLQDGAIVIGGILRPPGGMMHATSWWIAGADGGFECSNSEPRIDRATDGVTYDATRPSIEDRSQVHKAGFSAVLRFSEPLFGTRFRALVGQTCAPTPQSWLRIPAVDRQPGHLRPRRRLHASQPRRGSTVSGHGFHPLKAQLTLSNL